MVNVEKMIGNIAKKSGKEIGELTVSYNEILETIPAGDKREEKALRELNRKYVADKSSAVSQNFIVIGIGDIIDYSAKRRKEALEAYASDPDGAVSNGLVIIGDSGNAIPLDTKEFLDRNGKYKNNNFGKELMPQYNRNCIVLVKGEDGVFKRSTLNLRGKKAQSDLPPLNTEIKARLLGDFEKGFNTSEKATEYEAIGVKSEGEILDMLANVASDNIQVLGDCMEYINSFTPGTPEYYGRFVITSAEVNFVNETSEDKKSNFMVVDDITVDSTVNCFVPKHIELPDIGQTINIIAQPNIGKKWDPETKSTTDEDVLQLNVMGIISS